jgi:hypothetical protein
MSCGGCNKKCDKRKYKIRYEVPEGVYESGSMFGLWWEVMKHRTWHLFKHGRWVD